MQVVYEVYAAIPMKSAIRGHLDLENISRKATLLTKSCSNPTNLLRAISCAAQFDDAIVMV